MKRFFVNTTFFVAVMLSVSIYAPLRAMEDSTLVIPKTTERPFWMWQIFCTWKSSGFDADFNSKVLGIPQSTDNTTTELSFVISPIHVAWNHNRWIVSSGLNIIASLPGLTRFGSMSGPNAIATRSGFEYDLTVGYALINTPRFRLYPMISSVTIIDRVTITRQTSLANLLQTNTPSSFTMGRDGGGFGIAVGADYRFPLEYGDVYVVAKAGYTFSVLDSWRHEGVVLADANINWLSGRGVFLHFGIGLGSERQ